VRSVAEHYADALADVALSQNAAEDVGRELADFRALMRESPELGVVLGSPAVARTNKHAVVEALAARMGASRTLRNFLFVVINQRRMGLLPEIQSAFQARLDERRGITRADVTSARALNDAEKQQLQKTLERLSGRRIEAQYRLEPALIAGAVVRVGSTIYDGSVRTRLERLRVRLASQ
jgi:F-type H+-transporting ATPase subunit delta